MDKKNSIKVIAFHLLTVVLIFFLSPLLSISNGPGSLFAEESNCARVKIEIKQELTLERQAFDAHMRINNGLTHTSLENIQVDVWFTNGDGDAVLASSDPDNTDALFFIRVDEMSNIDNISGSGSTPADSSSDINWLIIPAPGASNGLEKGTLYNVGATLTYTIGGEENVIEVNPDYIFVKPMPELTLDYFLPSDVYGDDPFTQEIEPSIPFTLGVRVKNTGAGGAQNLKIDSAQPRIVDNDQGLLINFYIQGSEVNGEETIESLLVDFGTIDPDTSAIARWIMNCTVSGRFVEFEAQFSHADELGGELTSLIVDINTHTLVRDVLVDLSGRDTVRDFLSRADDLYKVYESDSDETDVTDQSVLSTLTYKETMDSESHYTLSTPVTAGFIYVQLPDPHNGSKLLKKVLRSDGKEIKPENAWLSKVQDRDTHLWDHFINLFDVNTTDTFTLIFDAITSISQKPVLQFITDKSGIENQQISFIVNSSDPNGTIPALSGSPLPVGAQFTDNNDGTGIFDWTPLIGQKGTYYITFTATDSTLLTSQRVKFTISDINDTDMDGMTDDWETSNFGVLARDGNGDFDQDGISDLQEFLDETDPTLDESAPTVPDPLYPHPNVDVTQTDPELVIENSLDTQNDTIDYEFEIYADSQMTDMVANQNNVVKAFHKTNLFIYNWTADNGYTPVPTSESTTNWQVPVALPDNARYYWRVRSADTEGSSLWAYNNFFVNTLNDPPASFLPGSPENESGVDSLTPQLSVMNSRDIDNDVLTYTFEVYEDEAMTILVTDSGTISQGAGTQTSWTVNIELTDNTQYYWRAIAFDGNGAQTATMLQSFLVNTSNHAPTVPVIISPDASTEIETYDVLLTVENSTDEDTDPLTYIFEIDKSDTFDSPDRQTSQVIFEETETTSFQVSDLEENQKYYWRVKAGDGSAASKWANAGFFVNRINDAPLVPTLKNPGHNAWVDTTNPVLSLHSGSDPDQDQLEYRFEIYSNQELTHFVVQTDSLDPDWTVSIDLKNNTRYFWRAQTIDEHGVTSAWTDVSDFFIKLDLVNVEPEIEITMPFEDFLTNAGTMEIQWTDSDPDSSAKVSLYYDTDNQGEDGILIIEDIEEDQDSDQDRYTWDISNIDDGVYYIYALISDEESTVYRYAPITITIDRTQPVLSVSLDEGNYEEPQTIIISSDEPADIYYTIDDSDPDTNSIEYTNPIQIDESIVLKSICVDLAGNISEIITREYMFNLDVVTLNVTTDSGDPVTNTKVYIFKESGSYYGKSAKTDEQGNALFDPNDFDSTVFKFRIDYLGNKFWTDPVQLPDDMFTRFIIPVETVNLTVTTTNGPVTGYKVYLFSQTGSYLGQYQTTDGHGQVSFTLPVGVSYKFRADVLGTQYWTGATLIQSGGANTVNLDTGGGIFTITLQKNENTPIPGIRMYLFSPTDSYLGRYKTTDANGQIAFEVSQADYKVRADYMGYKFWTDITTVSTDTVIDLTLPHKDIILSVLGTYQNTSEPITDIKAYLFSPSNSYLGKYQKTDENGQISFSLPDRTYKICADYLRQKFWSQEFTGEDSTIDIAMAKAQITVSGAGLPQSNIKVYLFSETNSYLGQYQRTDTSGQVMFLLPEGMYKFRADYEGSQYWSAVSSLAADIVNPVEISVGGGQFTFLAQTDTGVPISGIKCYVFTEAHSYIGLYSATDNSGEAFFALADGTYLFRFDYMGEQFWSNPVEVPDSSSYQMTLAHETAEVNVFTKNDTVKNTKVYLFSETGSYLGQCHATNNSGVASFYLPVGVNYKFRADVLGSKQYSDVIQITDTGTNQIDLDTGGGLLTVILQKDALTPIPDIKMYLFTESGSYTGLYSKTDAQGKVTFEVPNTSYKVRADYMGYKFWTEPEIISDDTSIDLTIPHGTIQVHVTQSSADVPGARAYLFNENDSYLEKKIETNTNGIANFQVPANQPYKIRVDINGQQYWSDAVTVSPDSITQIEREVE
ncbi:MAG: hypothetical protein GY857_09795 [Desulfobacula sp.]|nr:hypothetical protein [Desulfobacula sp.]